MAIGLNADGDYAYRATNIGSPGHAGITLAGWVKFPAAGQDFSSVNNSGIVGATHLSNGRCINLMFDDTFGDGTMNGPKFAVGDWSSSAGAATRPPFDTWVFVILRSGVAGGTLTGEWSTNGTTWVTQTKTTTVETSVQAEAVMIGIGGTAINSTAWAHHAYWHAYSSDIGQAAARALYNKNTPQNSPWAFWPLANNTDTSDTSGNGRTLTFLGTITSETSPTLGGGGAAVKPAHYYAQQRAR